MVINGSTLLMHAPIKDMLRTKETAHGTSYGLSEAGYDIRIAEEICFTRYSGYDSNSVNGQAKIGCFALASAIEEFNMPLNLVGVVHDKSTWIRQGLMIGNSVIEPGWKGYLTLELVFHGQGELVIPAGSGIAQIIFSELAHCSGYSGKYQSQEAGPQKARFQ